MDAQDQTKHHTPTGHESHGAHLCRRCGWPFPNPHPSARHRRSHKKICGTIDGYTNLIHSDDVSDDEHHLDDDKDKSPSPKIEKTTSIAGGGGGVAIERGVSRSEDDSFSDAVAEFADASSTGSVHKTLDRDLFFSFKDAENGEISKVNLEKPKLPESDGKSLDDVVKDGVVEPTLEQSDVSQSQEAEFVEVVGAGVNLETVTADGIPEEIKHENIESECEHVIEAVKEAELVHEHGSEVAKESEIDHEHGSEAVKEPETVQSVLVLTKKDDDGAPELEKDSNEQIQKVVEESDPVLIEKEDLGPLKLEKDSNEQIQEVVNEPVAVLTENTDLGAPNSENCSPKEIDEVVKEPKSVLIEKEDLGAPESEKQSNEHHTHEVFEDPESVLTEKENLGAENVEKTSKEDTMEVVQEPNSTLIEKEDLCAPKSENGSNEQIQEAVKEPISVLTKNNDLDEVCEEPKAVSTEKENLEAPILEKGSKEHTIEVIEEPNSNSIEKEDLGAPHLEKPSNGHTHEVLEEPETKKEDLGAQNLEKLPKEEPKVDNCIVNNNNVSEPIVSKLITNQDSGVDLSVDSSSRNSLEGNWGSVSVLSTASIDDKSKVNSGKLDNNSGTSDVFEPPSFMTLVEPKEKDEKHEVQDAEKAGWIPTITNVSNESEGRKKNEEVIAKVTNWTTGKHSAPLKSLLGEAKSPNVKESESVDHKDEGALEKQELLSSPPKLIEDGKKVGKKGKGKSSWMPFVCCSSVNVVN